jgi:uncharacterized membrane protein
MIRYFAILGLFLSFYALYLTIVLKHKPTYRPLCDLHKNISCSKAHSSNHARILYLPNALYGVIVYGFIIIFPTSFLMPYIALGLVLATLILSYISYVKQKNICLLCTATYIINLIIAYLVLF